MSFPDRCTEINGHGKYQKNGYLHRIGYWLADKKIRKLNFEIFENMCRNAGMEIVKLDLDEPLEPQGPFDIILHKLTDQIARSEGGCVVARKQIERFNQYVAKHPDIVVVDPIENVMKLFDRHQQYSLVQECLQSFDKQQHCHCFMPVYVELTSLDVEENKNIIKSNDVKYPIVIDVLEYNDLLEHVERSKQMSIVFNDAGLKDVEIPCVAQTFVNHNSRLFKIFVIGRLCYIVERPSIKNFSPGGPEKTIFFNSNDVSKPNSTSHLNEVIESELVLPIIDPDKAKLDALAQDIRITFGLDLFGIDVIIENETGRYAIIDINTFPGYEDVDDFFTVLLNLIRDKLDSTKSKGTGDYLSKKIRK